MAFDFGNSNNNQIEAIKTTEGPLLIIAGPGTGKTYTLVKRIVYLITEKDIKPEEIFIATFTDKAARELVTRITNELLALNIPVNLNEMYVGTFHSICLRILSDHLEYTRIKKNYRMLDQFDQIYLIFQNIARFKVLDGFDTLDLPQGSWKQAGQLASYINNFIEELVDTSEMKKDSDLRVAAIARCVDEYNTILFEENIIDFSSIQTECYSLLNNNPDILSKLQESIKYIMVDEYQDTNYIQEQLVFLLAGKKNNICVVGDDDQGLYRFRGATIRNILQFKENFSSGKCKQINLTENYRSEEKIIDFYNDWMSSTSGRGFSFDWGEFRFPKKIIGKKNGINRGKTVVKCSASHCYEAWHEEVLSFITYLKQNNILSDYNQIAYLCKSVKNDKVVGLINFLEENGINVYSPRSDIFFKRYEIRALLGCLIKCFPTYDRKLNRFDFEIIYEKLFNYYGYECLSVADEVIKSNNLLKEWIEEKRKYHKNMTENTDYAFTGLMYQLLEFEPFRSYVDVSMGSGVIDERPARNLSIFSGILAKYEYLQNIDVFSSDRIDNVVEYFFNMYLRVLFDGGIEEYEDDSEYAPKGCVSFMTIHQSKGLEFPVVLVGSINQRPDDRKDELVELVSTKYFHRKPFEERDKIKYFDFWRLYYTAFSRAQNLLVLTCNEVGGSWAAPSKYFEKLYHETEDWKQVDIDGIKLDSIKPVNIKDTYSFTSHIALYENCSLQYKFFKELGFTQVRIGATLFGTLVHETIEDVHRAAMRNEEYLITPENVRVWLDTNYYTLSKSEHSFLGKAQIDAAYNQVLRYIDRATSGSGLVWSHIQEAEAEVSLVKENYILKGKIDLIRGDGDTVEIVDFKSEKKPDESTSKESLERYRRQLEVYAYLVEKRNGKKVSKMHLYYTGEDEQSPMISFDKSDASIDKTIAEFDRVVDKIQTKQFSTKAEDRKSCLNCDMRYHCGEVTH